MVRPCVAREFSSASLVHLASMYPAFDWSLGRCIASAIASESRMSFFCPFEYGRTYCAGISRAWWPNPCSLRLRWCAPTSASIPMRQGRCWQIVLPPGFATTSAAARCHRDHRGLRCGTSSCQDRYQPTAIAVLNVWDMACSLSSAPLTSFDRWQGRSTAGPAH